MRLQIDLKKFDELSRDLKKAPTEVRAELRIALRIGLREIQRKAQLDHKFKSRGGFAEKSIMMDDGNTNQLEGSIYLDEQVAFYSRFLHEGTDQDNGGRHWVGPKNKKALRWATGGGFGFSRGHWVRGIDPDPFLYRAGENSREQINDVFERHVTEAFERIGMV